MQTVWKALTTSGKTAPVSHYFTEVPVYSFNEAVQLQGREMPGSEPKPLLAHQSAIDYCM